jgi:hypothetical protein
MASELTTEELRRVAPCEWCSGAGEACQMCESDGHDLRSSQVGALAALIAEREAAAEKRGREQLIGAPPRIEAGAKPLTVDQFAELLIVATRCECSIVHSNLSRWSFRPLGQNGRLTICAETLAPYIKHRVGDGRWVSFGVARRFLETGRAQEPNDAE